MVAAAISVSRRGRLSGPQAWAIALALITGVGALSPAPPILLFNPSHSEPPGLYVRTGGPPRSGEIIAFKTPPAAFPYAERKMAYLHQRPLLKNIVAGQGDEVCTTTGQLVVNGVLRAPIASRDRDGLPLPRWFGCRRLGASELFVFSSRIPNSFDSRYYGPVLRHDVLGVYRLVLAAPSEPT